MADPLGFRQKGTAIARGFQSQAEDADPSEESGFAANIGMPVWKQFVDNENYQKSAKGVIDAEQNYQRQVSHENRLDASSSGSGGSWASRGGKLLRSRGKGLFDEYDPETVADDPEVGSLARKTIWERDEDAAKRDADERSFRLKDPTDRRSLTDKERSDLELESSLADETTPEGKTRSQEVKKRLADADTRRKEEKEAYDAEVRHRNISSTDSETYFNQRQKPTLGQKREQAVQQVSQKRSQIEVADQSAAKEMAELNEKLATGVKGSEVAEVKQKLADLTAARAEIAKTRNETEETVTAPVRDEASQKLRGDRKKLSDEIYSYMDEAGRTSKSSQKSMGDAGGMTTTRGFEVVRDGAEQVVADAMSSAKSMFTGDKGSSESGVLDEAMKNDDLLAARAETVKNLEKLKKESGGSLGAAHAEDTLRVMDGLIAKFGEKGITDGKEMANVMRDAAKENTWAAGDETKVRQLSDGRLVFNPASVAERDPNSILNDIEATKGTDEEKSQLKENYTNARNYFAADLHVRMMERGDPDYIAHVNKMSATGEDDPATLVYSWDKMSPGWFKKNGDLVADIGVQTWRSIANTGNTALAEGAFAAAEGAEALGLSSNWLKEVATGSVATMQERASDTDYDEALAAARGERGTKMGVAKDLGVTVGSMAPMFAGGIGGGMLKTAAGGTGAMAKVGTAAQVAGVYGYSGLQGMQSIFETAIQQAEQQAAQQQRTLTDEERYAIISDNQIPAFANGIQTVLLTKLGAGSGVERAALGTVGAGGGKLTMREILTQATKKKSTLRAELSTLKPELKAMISAVRSDFAGEAIEEGTNQILEGLITQASVNPDMTMNEVVHQAVSASVLGGFIGAVIPGAKSLVTTNNQARAQKAMAYAAQKQILSGPSAARVKAAMIEADPEATPPTEEELTLAHQLSFNGGIQNNNLKAIKAKRADYEAARASGRLTDAAKINDEIIAMHEEQTVNQAKSNAEGVLIARDIETLRAEDDAHLEGATREHQEALATGDKGLIAAAEAKLAVAVSTGGRADKASAVMKVAAGASLSELTPEELGTLGYKKSEDGEGFDPMDAEEMKKAGLNKPLVTRGADGSPILLDEAIRAVKGYLPRGASRITMNFTAAMQKSVERKAELDKQAAAAAAAAAVPKKKWTVGLKSGATIEVEAADALAAEQEAAATATEQIILGSAVEVGAAPAASTPPATPPGAPGSKALEAAQKRIANLSKSKRLKDAFVISTDPKVRATQRGGQIAINPEAIIADAIAEGMSESQAARYFARVLDEEIRHLAHENSARAIHAKSKSTETFEDWRKTHYKAIWDTDFVATGKDAIIRAIYAADVTAGKKGTENFDSLPDWKKAFEAIRMMSQKSKTTEIGRLWINISDTLRQALTAALDALKALVADLDSTPNLKQEIALLEEALAELKKNDSNPADPADSDEKPPEDGEGDGTGEAGTGETASDGEADEGGFAPTGEPPVVGSKVEFERKGETLRGVVTKIKKGGAIVRLDVQAADGNDVVPVRVENLRVIAPVTPPDATPKPLGKNKQGHFVTQDDAGVRAYHENGISIQQAVGIKPGRGLDFDSPQELFNKRRLEYLTVEEIEAFEKAAKPPEAPPADPGKRSVAENTRIIEEWFHNLIYEGKPVTAKMVKEKGEVLGITTKEAEEITEAVISGMMQSIAQDPSMTNEVKFGHIVHFYENSLPALVSRTSESKANQAYSTPAPLAFVASILADIKGGKVVSEPTFGHGILLMMAGMNGQIVQGNELDPARVERSLAAIPGATEWNLSTGDATAWTPPKQSDRIISNPPFGKIINAAGETIVFQTSVGETSEIDHAIMLKQLEAMAPDGRAVFIIGGPPPIVSSEKSRAEYYAAGKRGAFFKHLYDNYGVVDHMTLNGKLYAKQGAAYPVDVIVIQGKKSTGIDLPSSKAPAMISSWDQLFSKTEQTDEQRIEQNTTPPQEVLDDLQRRLDELAKGNKGKRPKSDRRDPKDGRGDQPDDQQTGLPPEIPDGGQGGNGTGSNGNADGVPGGTGTGPDTNNGSGAGGPGGLPSGNGGSPPDGSRPSGGPKGVKPPRALTPLEKELAEGLDDLFSAPLRPGNYKKGIPRDKIATFMALVNKLLDAGVNTAEKLADSLSAMTKSLGKDFKQFSDALWNLFRSMEPDLDPVEDWDQTYKAVEPETDPEPAPEPEPEPKDPPVDPEEKEKVNEFQDKYIPASEGPTLGTLAPKNLSSAMRDALLALVDRVGPLHEFIRNELGYAADEDIFKYFAAEQIDALALAIDNFYQNGALIVGDQTGIGKGRVVAGLIKWTINKGLIPVFVTKNPSLMNAMLEDDMRDIGMDDFTPAITNNRDAKILKNIKALQTRKLPMGRTVFETIAETGELPPGANAVFTTYSQIGSDVDRANVSASQLAQAKRRKQAPPDFWRMSALKALSDRSVMILDESHLASGDSAVGYRFADLLAQAKHVYFSSATFAKRPESMAIYFRTNMRHVTQDGTMEKLIVIMQKGGVPAMQMASYMLAKDGQMLRRERDFDGVDFDTVISHATAENDIRRADIFTSGLREIVLMQGEMSEAAEEVNEIVKAFGQQFRVPKANRPKLESMNFAGKIHNLLSQYLLAVKADAVVEQARTEIESGRKVVVAVQSTMESGIERLRSEGRDPNYREMLLSHLDTLRTFKVGGGQEITISRTAPKEFKDRSDAWLNQNIGRIVPDPLGTPQLVLNDDVVEEIIRRKMIGVFLEYEARIEALDIADDLPLSPIDYMREKIGEFGIITNEITGRGTGIDEDGEAYKREIPGATDVMREFNAGDTHFLVINQSGSTGISLHDSEKNENAGKFPRTMIVAQPNLDINEFMQMLGRIHRSGQKSLPRFILLQTALPAERRPAAVLGIKMGMLNANTTSNDSSAVSKGNKAVDIFNKYGDEIVFQHLMTDRDLVGQLAMFPVIQKDHLSPDGFLVSMGEFEPGFFARRMTGYLAVMPTEEQELFWERVTENYTAHIAYLDEIGENDLKAQPIDMQAKTLRKTVFTPGKNLDSIFAGESYYETVEGIFGTPPASGQEARRIKDEMADERSEVKNTFARAGQAAIAEKRRKNEEDNAIKDAAKADSSETPEKKADRILRRRLKQDEFIQAQREQLNVTLDAIDKLGKWMTYRRDDGSDGLAIIESVSFDEKRPFAPSAQTFKLLLNDTKHSIRVPATKMDKYTVPGQVVPHNTWEMTMDNNTTRTIVTGNLLAALNQLDGSGKVIYFTRDNGDTEMGIMMPSDFTKREGDKRDARTPVTTAEIFVEKLTTGGTIFNSDEALRVKRTKKGDFAIRVPAKRAAGGKFWRNPAFTALLERPMEDTGSWSVSSIAEKDLPAMFEVIKSIGETLSAEKGKPRRDDGPDGNPDDDIDPDGDDDGGLDSAPLRADSPEWKAMSKEQRKAYLADRGAKKPRQSKADGEGGLNAAPLTPQGKAINPNTPIDVIDRQTKKVVWSGVYAKRDVARRVVDRRDNKYGGYRFQMRIHWDKEPKSDSILYAAPLTPGTSQNINDLRIMGGSRINQGLADNAREIQEFFDEEGDRTVGAPRLANPGDTTRSREEQMIVDALYEHDRELRKDADVIAEGRRRFLSDPKGVEEKVLAAGYNDGEALTDADVVAARYLINQRSEAAGNDLAKHEENMILRMAYRLARAETARSLRIGFDMFQTPEERAREFLTEKIYAPTLNIEKKAANENWSPAKRREAITAMSKNRLAQIEKAFSDMGVTLDEVLSGKAYLSLSKSAIMKEATDARSDQEKLVIEMLQKKWPISRIRKSTGFTEERIIAINKALYDELLEKARAKVRGGSSLANYVDGDPGLSAAPLTPEEIEAEARRIVEVGLGISPDVATTAPSKPKVKKSANPLTENWSRPVFENGLKSYTFDTKDRSDILRRITEIRALAGAIGTIKKIHGPNRAKAIEHLKAIDAILAKHGTSAKEIFDSETPVADYRFDIRDRAQVAILARVIQAIDADIVDKTIEWVYSSILSGIQTMTVNALAAIPATWDMTVGRGFEMAVNTLFKNDTSATAAEVKYILRAMGPALSRAMSNAAATWGSETPMFEEDILGRPMDLDKLFDGHAPRMGVIGGKKGRVIRIPTRMLLATDEFNRTAIAVIEVGAMAYRLAKAKKLVPGTAKFDRFLKMQVNTPGSFASKLAADKASRLIFTNALPGQINPVTGKKVPREDIGDLAGMLGAAINKFVTQETDSLVTKAALAALRLAFFPFQRTPFNIIRRGVRHTLNPISMIDIGILFARNSYALGPDGHHHWKWNGGGRNAEIVERLAQQLQGAMLLLFLMGSGAGEGDDDDQKKPLLITGSQPFTLKGMAERETQYRAGLGPYRISIRNKDGTERFGFNYGRLEPLATTLASTIDMTKAIKRAIRSGKGSEDIALSALESLTAQTQDKTFMKGTSDLISLADHLTQGDSELKSDKKIQQFLASRFGMFIPNVIKQPVRESDSSFRERADTFTEEMLYQMWPSGIKGEKLDTYGNPVTKPGNALTRTFDVTDAGKTEVNDHDKMLLTWRDKHPDKAWFPQPIGSAEWKNPRTKESARMNAAQLAMFREQSGKLVTALLKRQSLNTNAPTQADVDRMREIHTEARAKTKRILSFTPKFVKLTSTAP